MLVSEIVRKVPGPLSPKDELADLFREDFEEGIDYLAVVEENKFLGFLPLADLETEKEINKNVGECDLEKVDKPATAGQHFFEVLVLFRKANLPVLPVLDEKGDYDGFILLGQALEALSDSYAFQTEGGVIVLSVMMNDYSLSEISRLVETNQSKILAVVAEADPLAQERLIVHLKINQKDLSRIVATLERFDYQVVEVHHKSESTSLDQERLDLLMKYLGI